VAPKAAQASQQVLRHEEHQAHCLEAGEAASRRLREKKHWSATARYCTAQSMPLRVL